MTGPETPDVPPWPKFCRPMLEVLSDGQVWRTRDLKPAVMDQVGLSGTQRAVTLSSGPGQADNRIGWALSFLTRAQAIAKIKNGESRITDFGRQLLQDHPVEITEATLEAVPAFQAYVPKKRATTTPLATDHLPSYWFVGAFFVDSDDYEGPVGDRTEEFIEGKRWYNGSEGKYHDLVKAMKPGERIAIKAAFTRLHEMPFDTKGNRVSVMAIKATGTINHNPGDGQNIEVNWDPPAPVREWYFYTNQQTVWRVKPAGWKAKALIDFTFHEAEQEYDEFRNDPYWAERFGDAAPEIIGDEGAEETTEEETAATKNYGVRDIIDDGCFVAERTLQSYLDALERKKNLILQGPPGTGKTWLAKRLGRALIGEESSDLLQSVQFHPSLSYEDFVRGWRPSGDGTLALIDGLFLDLIKKAEHTPGSKHVLVIEEINRGNLAQVFGELLTLLEADKRDAAEALTLTYRRPGEDRVHIPENLYIIGTMNLADRSLAIVDFALRRRFAFADLAPQFNEAWQAWVSNRNGIDVGFLAALASRIEGLNLRIADDRSLGAQYQVGHSFFTPPTDTTISDPNSWVAEVVEREIRPLLSEYWFDEPLKVTEEVTALIGTT